MLLPQEAAEEEEKELTPDEMGRKIASQWTTDPEAADSTQSSTPAPAADTAEEVRALACVVTYQKHVSRCCVMNMKQQAAHRVAPLYLQLTPPRR